MGKKVIIKNGKVNKYPTFCLVVAWMLRHWVTVVRRATASRDRYTLTREARSMDANPNQRLAKKVVSKVRLQLSADIP